MKREHLNNDMKSPITGKDMTLQKEPRTFTYREKTFLVLYYYYRCEDSGEQFTTTALDEINVQQLYDQYRNQIESS